MDIETKIDLVKRKPTTEVVTEAELRSIFENYAHPRHYVGFEISGLVHIGSGLCNGLKIKDFLAAGIKPTIFLADYHAYINEKLGGDLEKIQAVAKGYFKHAFISLGLEENQVDYVLASSIYDGDYWKDVLKITKDTTINRMLRCVTIMGRKETEATSSASIVYPAMQAADIFKLDVQIAHAGTDQRKVHMLAKELSHTYKKQFVAVHHHLLTGLQGTQKMNVPASSGQGAVSHEQTEQVEIQRTTDRSRALNEARELIEIDAKMSKSVPNSAIFIHDSEEEIKNKIKKAYCPEKIIEGNPMIDYAEYLVLRDKPMKVERPEKFGGDLDITNADELKKIYLEGKLHPVDLKATVARELIEILKPSREYFAKHQEYLEQVKEIKVTR
ncbi:MAG: tyrosine--tRNA ligase [Candidatus Micrarchaeota archaeon]